ncbi:N-formylglutamate amidohydrolase [Pseudorhodoplanes sinuspersici]|uniref:N-formylglutamate amidohydrolase n=1 Tax=Pseudorhodoplanes sinuspersici TaxID=1235591 RepID=A0A1W6ZS01_9HYPH|nr:N-formylglutamate amidohydrolase [Pseudorhodoplanes sinuspersici]ARQ00058.1 N-formylglutamate amidohydrolase [Pseudorhodoplanes sinuspersici]RKE71095.1 putative N-formylglutamate amidohydrolase [Pseudorhodoplanes sinuspersici]
MTGPSLLAPEEPAAVVVLRPEGSSPFLLVSDHAGRRIPKKLGDLGVSESELRRHIAYDVGIEPVVRFMAEELDAPAILQPYSRLVIDCNRPFQAPTSIAPLSEDTPVPGNVKLTRGEIEARQREIFAPYHNAITTELDRREREDLPAFLVAMHSFTPVYKGMERPWHSGVLYNRDSRFAAFILRLLREEDAMTVGDNEPYMVSDDTDYTIPVHGEQRGIPHVAIEIRHDLIETESDQRAWAERICRILKTAKVLRDESYGVGR